MELQLMSRDVLQRDHVPVHLLVNGHRIHLDIPAPQGLAPVKPPHRHAVHVPAAVGVVKERGPIFPELRVLVRADVHKEMFFERLEGSLERASGGVRGFGEHRGMHLDFIASVCRYGDRGLEGIDHQSEQRVDILFEIEEVVAGLDFEDVADYAVCGDFEDWRIWIFIDSYYILLSHFSG